MCRRARHLTPPTHTHTRSPRSRAPSAPHTPAPLPQDGKLTTAARLTAGLGAGVSEALLIVTPFEVVKTRLQQQKGVDKALLKYHGPVHTALTVAREEGVLKLWSGATATTIRQGSNQMSLFWGKAACDALIWDKHVRAGAATGELRGVTGLAPFALPSWSPPHPPLAPLRARACRRATAKR